MKNIVFGMLSMMILLYTAAISLGVYNTYVRKNELNNSLSHVMRSVMEKYTVTKELGLEKNEELLEKEMEGEVIRELRMRLSGDREPGAFAEASGGRRDLQVRVTACDLEKGILGVSVKKTYTQINGEQRQIGLERVLFRE